MQPYTRQYSGLSLCGLNCGLCPRYYTDGGSRCPGCGAKGFFAKNPSCGVMSCARRHGDLEYCFLCEEFPCAKYDGADKADSFITHLHQFRDMEKAKAIGIQAYKAEQDEKGNILRTLLRDYNDGRKKTFYCTAVNLLELADVKAVMAQVSTEIQPGMSPREKSAVAADVFQHMAEKRGIPLKLRKAQKAK